MATGVPDDLRFFEAVCQLVCHPLDGIPLAYQHSRHHNESKGLPAEHHQFRTPDTHALAQVTTFQATCSRQDVSCNRSSRTYDMQRWACNRLRVRRAMLVKARHDARKQQAKFECVHALQQLPLPLVASQKR